MRKEDYFSKGERGKFYRPDAVLNLPVYLEPDVANFVRELAKAKKTEMGALVNEWLRQDIALIGERTVSKGYTNAEGRENPVKPPPPPTIFDDDVLGDAPAVGG